MPMTSLIMVWLIAGLASAAEPAPFHLAQTIPLPGVEGRIDHLAFDAKAHRLYVAAIGNGTVEVVDLAAGHVIHEITGLKEPQDLLVFPATHRLVVANGGDGTVRVYDTGSFERVGSISLGADADNMRYDARRHLVYVGFGSGGIAVIDPATWTRVATMPMPGHPEAFAIEEAGDRLFVNVPGADAIEVESCVTRTRIATWPLAGTSPGLVAFLGRRPRSNFPMALDGRRHRLFVGCRSPACLIVYDTRTGKAVAQLTIPGDADDLFYDGRDRRILASCGEGGIDIIRQVDADHYAASALIATAPGARTSRWIPETRTLYLAAPHEGAHQAEVLVYHATP